MATWTFQCKICGKEVIENLWSHLKTHGPLNYYLPVMQVSWEDIGTKTVKPKPKPEPEPEEVEETEEE